MMEKIALSFLLLVWAMALFGACVVLDRSDNLSIPVATLMLLSIVVLGCLSMGFCIAAVVGVALT